MEKRYFQRWICSCLFMCVLLTAMSSLGAPMDSKEALKQALIEIQKGAYQKAVDILEKLPASEKNKPAIQYWSGVSNYKLQKYEQAIPKLQRAVESDPKGEFKDSAYLLGQSFYASQEFRKARDAFKKSSDRDYMKAQSLYYVGYCSNVLNEDERAMKEFNVILALPGDEMKQAALFQLAELHNESIQNEKDKKTQKDFYKGTVIPAYEKTIAFNEEDSLANQSKERIAEIKKKIGDDIPRTRNGTPIAKKPYMILFIQEFKYDTNIINEADQKILKVTKKYSPIEKSSILGKYEFIFDNWILVTPEVGADLSYTMNRRVSEVIANDNANLNPALRTRLDHFLTEKKAAGLVEYEFSYGWKDYNSKYELPYYNQSHNFILGERIEYFDIGSTTLKTNLKFYENQDTTLNYIGPGVTLNQNFKLDPKVMLNSTIGLEKQTAKAPKNDQINYRIITGLSLLKIFWDTNVNISVPLAFQNYINQKSTRGTERNLAPGITFTRYFDKNEMFGLNVNYTFTRNWSIDKENYAYKKHVVGFSIQITI